MTSSEEKLCTDLPGAAPFSEWPAFVTRLAQSRVISIAKVRGRARGHGSELALACDMRFASREKAIFAQTEVGSAVVPGGGATEWLTALAGRSRALEIIVGADDFDAIIAEKYGWVNRALPDAELDGFVDNFARRIASFEKRPLELARSSLTHGPAFHQKPSAGHQTSRLLQPRLGLKLKPS